MNPELSWEYLHSIPPEPIPRLIEQGEQAWVESWKGQCARAINGPLVGLPLYDAWPSSWPISKVAGKARLEANWARLVEYDRLTEERRRPPVADVSETTPLLASDPRAPLPYREPVVNEDSEPDLPPPLEVATVRDKGPDSFLPW